MPAAGTELSHVYPSAAAVDPDGRLTLAGCDATQLAREFGTPLYAVSPADLRRRARSFTDALRGRWGDGEVLFAAKSFPCTAVMAVLAAEGLSCDVASGGELALALAGGFDPGRIYLHGNALTDAELAEALAARVGHVVLESADELERLAALASSLGIVQEVMLRVAPGVSGDTHAHISTGQADTKFGLSVDDARLAIDRLGAIPALSLVGLHAHIGSQLFDLEPFAREVAALGSLGSFDVYDVGGGLAAPYLESDEPPSPERWVEAITDAARGAFPSGARLLVEPGRSLVANSTVTLYTVQSVKRNVSTWVAVDGGMSDNLRPMMYGAVYEAALADRPLAAGDTRCHVAGKHCESSDVIVRDALLPEPVVGDVLVTPVTGAYGYAMANNYNAALRPPVVFCEDGDARLVVRRESYADLLARDVVDD